MRLTLITLLFLLSFSGQVAAQTGLPFITEIKFDRQFNDSRIGSMVQDSEESMFFSTSRGVLKFDGSSWSRINTTSPVLKIHRHANSNRMFVGLKIGAAEILKTDSGTFESRAIPGFDSNQPFQEILSTDKDVFFVGETELFRYTPLMRQEAEVFQFPDKLISGAFLHKNELFILFYQEGLYKWTDGELEEIGKYRTIAEDPVLFSFETNVGTFVGFENDALYYFFDNLLLPVSNQLKRYLSNNILSDGILINDSLMALSTLAGGAVVVNVKDQRIRYRFDYTTGIKDNEIFCLGTDKDQGLWLAYESGLGRVDLAQPVKGFGGYPGLEGNLTSSIVSKGQLHVATGNGVFVLKEAKNRAEIQRVVATMLRKKREADHEVQSNYIPPITTNPVKEKKKADNLLLRYSDNPEAVKKELSKKELRELKKKVRQQKRERKNSSEVNALMDDFIKNQNEQEEKQPETRHQPKTTKALIPNPTNGSTGSGMTAPPGSGTGTREKPQVLNSKETVNQPIRKSNKSYIFKKVKGLDVKCRQLITWNNQVFAATNNGLYLILGENSKNLTPDVYINQAVVSNNKKSLLLATLNGIFRLKKQHGAWLLEPLNDTIRFVAYNVLEDKEAGIWAGTDNGAYRYFADETRFYGIPNITNERVLVAQVYDEVHFLLRSGLYHYVAQTDTILYADLPEIPSSSRLDFLLGNDGVVWVRSNYGWHVLNGDKYISMLPYLDLFEDIRQITTDEKGNLYVIDKGINIYSVLSRPHAEETPFNVYIGQALNADRQPFSLGQLTVDAKNNQLIFTISAPFYLKSNSTQYQYRIEGLLNSWSKWSNKTEIEQYVPAGDYVLQVRAKNVLGEVSQTKSLPFTVEKPIWQRWYFILLYALILIVGILGVIKIRERSLRETQRELEGMVEKRTADLAKAKDRAEELLLNILPKETAEELQKNGKATARHYNQVSVLFTDFKGFTQFAENTTPEALVTELHRCFSRFDEIIDKYKLEKIKTIGDAYMCAGGVPIKNSSNAIAITLAALEIRDYMNEVVAIKKKRGEPILEVRIGIHTGPLTAGVVGKKKFAYDIWGDTVNTASRMETASEPGRVNVSGTTHALISKYFEAESRGKRQAKGKGLVEMYFIESIKPNFSENGNGMEPNKEMWDIIG